MIDTMEVPYTIVDIEEGRFAVDHFGREGRGAWWYPRDGQPERLFDIGEIDAVYGISVHDGILAATQRMGGSPMSPSRVMVRDPDGTVRELARTPTAEEGGYLASPIVRPIVRGGAVWWITADEQSPGKANLVRLGLDGSQRVVVRDVKADYAAAGELIVGELNRGEDMPPYAVQASTGDVVDPPPTISASHAPFATIVSDGDVVISSFKDVERYSPDAISAPTVVFHAPPGTWLERPTFGHGFFTARANASPVNFLVDTVSRSYAPLPELVDLGAHYAIVHLGKMETEIRADLASLPRLPTCPR